MIAHHFILALVFLIALAALAIATAPAMASSPNLRDALLKLSLALSNGAGTVTSAAMDLGNSTTLGISPDAGGMEYIFTAPALTTTQLPNATTQTYNILYSANSDMSSPTTYIAAAVVQTGAGGAGAAAATFRFKLPSTASRYLGFSAVGGTSVGNCSAASATLEALF